MHKDKPNPRFALSPTSGVPLYRQLMDAVRAEVASGRQAPGSYLPSVRIVAMELEINPMTVSKAYSRLEAEGTLERVLGQGMRVMPKRGRKGVAERRALLKPLLEQLVARANQLDLSPSDLRMALEPLLKEMDDA